MVQQNNSSSWCCWGGTPKEGNTRGFISSQFKLWALLSESLAVSMSLSVQSPNQTTGPRALYFQFICPVFGLHHQSSTCSSSCILLTCYMHWMDSSIFTTLISSPREAFSSSIPPATSSLNVLFRKFTSASPIQCQQEAAKLEKRTELQCLRQLLPAKWVSESTEEFTLVNEGVRISSKKGKRETMFSYTKTHGN